MSLLSIAAACRISASRVGRWLWRTAAWLVLGLTSLSLAAWLTLHWGILPRLDDWRPRLETVLTARLGIPVQIGRLQAHSTGWVPAFRLHEVVLRDALGREALRLPQVSVALSVPSLLSFQPRLAQVLIDGPRLHVRRDAQGRWQVGGLDMAGEGPSLDSGNPLDWLLDQGEFVIRQGQVLWVDELRQAPPLALTQVQLVLRNQGRRHQLRLDATPPADWGAPFQVVVQARQPLISLAQRVPASEWRAWVGQAYVHLPGADVASLRRHVDLPAQLRQGRLGARAWLDWDRARPEGLTLDLALQDVALALVPGQPALALRDASTRLQARRLGDGGELALQRLTLRTPEGDAWPLSDLALRWQWAQPALADQALLQLSHPAPAAPAMDPPAAHTAPVDPWAVNGGSFQASQLNLATLAALAERLPVGASVRQLLLTLQPEGLLNGLDAQWQGPLDAPRTYKVKAALRNTALAAAPSPEPDGIGRPGWRGADLDLQASETGGQASLRLQQGAMAFPGVFEPAAVALKRFSAQLSWRLDRPAGLPADAPPKVTLSVQDGRFEADDVQGELEATWHTGPGSGFGKGGRLPGVLSLSGTLPQGRASAVARYLPLGIPADTRLWVRQAVQAGEVRDVGFRVQGDLWDFPFVNRREGEFRIAGQLQGVTLAPVPSYPAAPGHPAWTSPWPAFSQVSGALVFERNSMQFQNAQGRLWGLQLDGVQGRIRELSSQALLEVEGQVKGPAADLLRYVHGTPVNDWTARVLAEASATGTADLRLALNLPLAHMGDSQVRGDLQLAGNDLRVSPAVPLLANARGRIGFTQRGLQLQGVRTQVLGGEAVVDGATQADGSLRVTVNGQASAEALRRVPELAGLAPLARHLQGQTGYRLQLGLANGQPEWLLTSALQGMAIALPPPLAKPADQAWPLRLQTSVVAGSSPGSGALRDQVRLSLGPLQALLLRDLSGAEPQVLRSAFSFAAPLPEPQAGGRAVLHLPPLDIDPWRRLLADGVAATAAAPGTTAGGAPGATGAGAPGGATGAGASGASGGASGAVDVPAGGAAGLPAPPAASAIPGAPVAVKTLLAEPAAGARPEPPLAASLPASVRLTTPELRAAGRRLSSVALDLQRLPTGPDAGWQAQVQSDQTSGNVQYTEPRPGLPAGRVRAQLSHLVLPPAEAERVAGELGAASADVPALDIEVQQFELRGRPMGRLVVKASTRGRGAAQRSDWLLDELRLELAGAGQLRARGVWQPPLPGPVAPRRVALEFTLGVANAGDLLERLGFGRVLKGGQGELKGTLGWDGSPLAMDLGSLGGAFSLKLGKGQFLKANAGAARLLGVLSLQALPRRLTLDFSDLFQQGFAFDDAAADLALNAGVVSTRQFRMRGLQAVVLLEGSADLQRETQNLHVVVVPELNAASASLAYAAINPAVGLGALLGQWLLRDPIERASAREFRISGTWDEPQVQRIDRGLLDPVPLRGVPAPGGAAPASAAASAPAEAPASAPAPMPVPVPVPVPVPASAVRLPHEVPTATAEGGAGAPSSPPASDRR